MGINIIKQISTANTTTSPERTISYIVIHYTAGISSKIGNAKANAAWFGNPSAQASADFVVDDAQIVQVNGDIRNRYCWAVGGSKYNTKGGRLYGVAKNKNCISIEICSNNKVGKITYPNDPNYYFTEAAVNNAISLTQYLMKEYGINADHVIRHYDVNGKQCPGIIGWNADTGDESKWAEFKQQINGEYKKTEWYRVRLEWNRPDTQLEADEIYGNAVDCANQHPGYGVFNSKGELLYRSKGTSIDVVIANQTKEKSLALLKTLPDYKGLPSSEQDYLTKVAELVVKMYPYTRILPSVVISQACLEPGFGLAPDAKVLVEKNNLVGQKASLLNSTWESQTVWNGTSFIKNTPEVYNGVHVRINDAFRVFDNWAASLLDYELFLTHAKLDSNTYKYRKVVGMTNPQQMIEYIRQMGYATSLTYVTSVMRLINQYDLTKYDKIAIKALQEGSEANIPVNPAPTPSPTPQPKLTPAPVVQEKTVYYRVQVGVFSNAPTRDILIDNIKSKLGLSCFSENIGGRYYVYCGSYENKNTANQRVTALKSNGFDAFVKEVKI